MLPIREIAFAATLSVASLYHMSVGYAHEMKIGNLVIEHPWSRQPPMAADVAAGYMKITNTGTEDDRLVKATAEITGTVQLHDMKMDGDVMKMIELTDGIPIPAGQTVELKPKSLHVMFMDLKTPPKEGDEFKGTLTFEKAGTIEVEYAVEAPDAGMN
jgi:periplasmic copper chaperone A